MSSDDDVNVIQEVRNALREGRLASRTEDYGGLDMDSLLSLVEGLRPNPVTGEFERSDIERALLKNMTSERLNILNGARSTYERLNGTDLSTYDFASLANTIQTDNTSVWICMLEYAGMVNASKTRIDDATARITPGAMPLFSLECKMARPSASAQTRWVQDSYGLPNSATVLKFIQHAIATPTPPQKPKLPQYLYLTQKFAPHIPTLRPFLDSLPAPFCWELERPEAAELHSEIAMMGREYRLEAYVKLAQTAKAAGNTAFAQKDREGAVKAYTEAIEQATIAIEEGASEESVERSGVHLLLAVCLSNRAATYLLQGDDLDAHKALRDAEMAERSDKSYVKAYYRQSRAHELLGDINSAKAAIERALSCASITDKQGLAARLSELECMGF
ncbi:hypothetical protein BV25DRAFT_1595569 [Artomyces pyxidatus]|uniref:Uncharacterized protein n=1 Tax=Artomyces pyxidatus TaxID=48021 RepID=A0ACB8TCG0_9AGAM|nr:hypothetical protein BV25DRAFT_1595569 [Artomyces pyxidatus]